MSRLNVGTLDIQQKLKLPSYTTAQRDLLSPEVGAMIYNTTEEVVQIYAPTEEWVFAGTKVTSSGAVTALGGTISQFGDYIVHTFTDSDGFSIQGGSLSV